MFLKDILLIVGFWRTKELLCSLKSNKEKFKEAIPYKVVQLAENMIYLKYFQYFLYNKSKVGIMNPEFTK